jgi:ATP-dependent DNA helicase RecG
MEKYSSGIQLAETDLQLRGPGEIYGTAQHGFPQFKVASYTDLALIETARGAAEKILPHLDTYPVLRQLIKEDKIQLVQPN